jgi:hypothetical protein
MISTELSRLPEELFNSRIVLLIPVDFGLRHQNGNVFFQALIELFE